MKQIWMILVLMLSLDALGAGRQQQQYEERKRDPFTTSDKMYAEAGMQPSQRSNARYGGFIPGYGNGAQKAPKMRLKGYVTKNAKKATALLEIEGAGVYMVSKGDEIGLHAIGSNSVLKIVDVGPNGVKVQSGRVNQVIIIR